MRLKIIEPEINLDDFILSKDFAKINKISLRALERRLKEKHVTPMPCILNRRLVFEPDAEIIIPPKSPIKGGRPKGTTKEVLLARGKKAEYLENRRKKKIQERNKIKIGYLKKRIDK